MNTKFFSFCMLAGCMLSISTASVCAREVTMSSPDGNQPASNKYNKLNRKNINEKNTQGYSTEVRVRALDGIPFNESLKLDMEIWSWTDSVMEYSVGTCWYMLP